MVVSGLKILFLITVIFIVLIILLFLSYLRIELVFTRLNNDDEGYIRFSVLKGLFHYRLTIRKLDLKGLDEGIEIQTATEIDQDKTRISIETIKQARQRYHEVLKHFSYFQSTIQWLLNKVICEKFLWSTSIGTGEAMETGVAVGVLWGLMSSLVGFFGRYIQWRHTPELYAAPNFQQVKLESHIHLIICIRMGNAICGIYRLLMQMRKTTHKEGY